jgi:hypothetical protein
VLDQIAEDAGREILEKMVEAANAATCARAN